MKVAKPIDRPDGVLETVVCSTSYFDSNFLLWLKKAARGHVPRFPSSYAVKYKKGQAGMTVREGRVNREKGKLNCTCLQPTKWRVHQNDPLKKHKNNYFITGTWYPLLLLNVLYPGVYGGKWR